MTYMNESCHTQKYVKYNYTRSSHDHGIPPRHGHGYPRHGRNSRRDHGHAREPWLRDRQGSSYSLKEGDEEQGPREIPFGKSDIMYVFWMSYVNLWCTNESCDMWMRVARYFAWHMQ